MIIFNVFSPHSTMLACLDLNFRNDNYHLRKGIEKLQKEKTDMEEQLTRFIL